MNQALTPLLDRLVQANGIQHDAVVSMFFTLTPDLTRISPAKIARLHLQWGQVPMMCAQEPFIEGLPTHCVRVLIQFYTTKAQRDIHHIYLKGAQVLRPDLRPEESTE
jgi:chorismate mutase